MVVRPPHPLCRNAKPTYRMEILYGPAQIQVWAGQTNFRARMLEGSAMAGAWGCCGKPVKDPLAHDIIF